MKAATKKPNETKKPNWTEEEEAALLEGFDKYGLDFGRIKVEYGALLENRQVTAIEFRCYTRKNTQLKEKYRELKAAIPKK